MKQKKQIDLLVKALFDELRYIDGDLYVANAVKDELSKMHRTDIQTFMRVMRDVIEHYAEWYGKDLRNEDSHDWAIAVKELNKPEFRFI